MSRVRFTFAIVLTACALAPSGCGYNNNGGGSSDGYQWNSIYRKDISTVAVPIFKSTDYQRGVEFTLSKALVNQIEASTPYKVVAREKADTIIEGEIVSVRANTLSSDQQSALPQEQMLDLTINFTWKDLRTGRVLVSRRGMERSATWYATLGEGRFVGTQEAAEKLAVAIVQELQGDW